VSTVQLSFIYNYSENSSKYEYKYEYKVASTSTSTSTYVSSTSTSTQPSSTSTSTSTWNLYSSCTRVQVQVPSTTSLVSTPLCSTKWLPQIYPTKSTIIGSSTSFLAVVRHCTKFCGTMSGELDITVSILQGSAIGPASESVAVT